jgi:hypothetical protein
MILEFMRIYRANYRNKYGVKGKTNRIGSR